MNTRARSSVLAASAACLFGGALTNAGTVVYDNSDLAFLMIPDSYSFGPPFQAFGPPSNLHPLFSPADNAAGIATGDAFNLSIERIVFTSSQITFDFLFGANSTGTDIEFALQNTTLFINNGAETVSYQPLAAFEPGDTVGPSDFATGLPDTVRGPTAAFSEGGGLQLVPLLGDETIVGFRFTEPGGIRYGFVQLTWFEDIVYERADFPGTFTQVDLYLPTAWGYSDVLDQGALVVLPVACAADIDGDGDADPDDINAFVDAFTDAIPGNADVDGDGDEDPDDITAFVDAFVQGC